MAKTSIIIPSRNEIFLPQTVDDLFAKASGEIEVIVTLDGYWPNPPLIDRPNLIIIHHGKPKGMRAGINHAAAIAKGKYLLKTDAHCMFAEGYDEVLKADCADNWMVIPRRYSLQVELYECKECSSQQEAGDICAKCNSTKLELVNSWVRKNKSPVDYHYLCCPTPGKDHDVGMHGVVWNDRRYKRSEDPQYDIDDEMSFQGSCWFMTKYHFDNFLHGMSEEGYGTFSQEPQEIGLKTWLGGGEIKVNKKTWYAHLHKGTRWGRMYSLGKREIVNAHRWSSIYWMNNQWSERKYDLRWLIERFWPVPTWDESWLKNWDEEIEKWNKLI